MGLLIMFICNHCPYVKAIQDRLVRDTNELIVHGINSVAIMPNDPADYPEDSFENMQKVAKAHAYPFPYLIDSTQGTAKDYGAICTPDFFGYIMLIWNYSFADVWIIAVCRQNPMPGESCLKLCNRWLKLARGRKIRYRVSVVLLNGAHNKQLPGISGKVK